jgi:hypothetical protein
MTQFFFEDESVQNTAQNHIDQILALEQRESERIIKLYRKVRHELRDRLEYAPKGTFTEEKLRGTLAQVELAIDAMSKNLTKGISDSSDLAAEKGIDHLITEINKYNKIFKGSFIPINLDAAVVASDTDNLLFNRYKTSIDAYSGAIRSRIAQGLTEAVVQQLTLDEVVGSIGRTFQGEEWKLLQISRTELHNVYSQGKLRGMSDLWGEGKGDIPDLKKTLFHPMDLRTGSDSKRLAQNNPIVDIDEPFIEDSTGKKLTYMAPPNRPNDRAILIPYREEWKK